MIEAWKNASVKERIGAVLITAAMAIFVAGMLWAALSGNVRFTIVDPNDIPANVQHSPLAVEHLEACMNQNVRVSASGGLRVGNQTTPVTTSKSVYPNGLIECLYAAGFTLEYNGEPVRREVTPAP